VAIGVFREKKNIAFMKEKLKLGLVMNLSGKIAACDPKENLLFRLHKISCETAF
jgi:hypothetical protein